MSKLSTPSKVKYFYSVLFNDMHSFEHIKKLMETNFFTTDYFSPQFNPLLEYYSHEMGDGLKRAIFYSHELLGREELVSKKLLATEIEIRNSSTDQKRSINIDVGQVAKEQVILATGKPYSHRIYLSDGVYAELVYFYQNKSFQKVNWTYPDYQHQEKIEFFNSIR